jgi:hypothetical protein
VWSIAELPSGNKFPDGVSMVTDGKNLYQYYDYYLSCINAKTGAIVKEKELPEMASYASPALIGGNLYLIAGSTTLILNADPATDFAEIGKGTIKDSIDASPAFVDGKVLLRGGSTLYCIGAK